MFNGVQIAMAKATFLRRPKDDGERSVARLAVGKAFDTLEDQVRKEMGTDKLAPMKVDWAADAWRTGWDLNPGQACTCTSFQDWRHQPDSATRPRRTILGEAGQSRMSR